jgi:hypothetical protein
MPIARRTAIGLAAGAIAGLFWPAARAGEQRLFPADGTVEFVARRLGRVVGGHRLRFAHAAERFVVRTDIALDIRAGAAPLHRFTHHAEEVWIDGWLDAVVSDTDDDGRRYRVRAQRVGGIFSGAVNGAAFTVSGYVMPSSLWHRDTTASEALFDTIDARVKVVRAELLGSEDVPVGGTSVAAKHYALTGNIARDLWYDADFNLVRIAWLGRDGAQIVFAKQ